MLYMTLWLARINLQRYSDKSTIAVAAAVVTIMQTNTIFYILYTLPISSTVLCVHLHGTVLLLFINPVKKLYIGCLK